MLGLSHQKCHVFGIKATWENEVPYVLPGPKNRIFTSYLFRNSKIVAELKGFAVMCSLFIAVSSKCISL